MTSESKDKTKDARWVISETVLPATDQVAYCLQPPKWKVTSVVDAELAVDEVAREYNMDRMANTLIQAMLRDERIADVVRGLQSLAWHEGNLGGSNPYGL